MVEHGHAVIGAVNTHAVRECVEDRLQQVGAATRFILRLGQSVDVGDTHAPAAIKPGSEAILATPGVSMPRQSATVCGAAARWFIGFGGSELGGSREPARLPP